MLKFPDIVFFKGENILCEETNNSSPVLKQDCPLPSHQYQLLMELQASYLFLFLLPQKCEQVHILPRDFGMASSYFCDMCINCCSIAHCSCMDNIYVDTYFCGDRKLCLQFCPLPVHQVLVGLQNFPCQVKLHFPPVVRRVEGS